MIFFLSVIIYWPFTFYVLQLNTVVQFQGRLMGKKSEFMNVDNYLWSECVFVSVCVLLLKLRATTDLTSCKYQPTCVNKHFQRATSWQTSFGAFQMNVFLRESLSQPQSPKPISQSSDDRGSFSSFLIGSEGKKRGRIAAVGGWELRV